MGMTWIDGTVLLKGQKAPFSPPQAPEWLPLPWRWGSLRIPPNATSHSLAAKGKERLGQNTGAHTGSQTHLILVPHASGWRLSLASSLLTPLHPPACPSVFSSTHYLHQRFDFHPPPPVLFFLFFHLKVIAIPGAFILDDVVVVRWSTCSSQSAVDLNAGESQQWA